MRFRHRLQRHGVVGTLSSLRLFLGGLDLAIEAEEEILLPEAEAYRPFFSTGDRSPGPDAIPVRLVVTAAPRVEGRVIFESDASWSILEKDGRRMFVDRDASGPILTVPLEPGSAEVSVECSPAWVVRGPSRAIRCPLRYPLDQILTMSLLGRQGLIVHAAGWRVGGAAVVLAGVSGAGKTTFSRLAEDRDGWKGLSDDRVIVRVPDDSGEAVAHGTPWPGEGRIAARESGPLSTLLFLAQGPENALEPLAPAQAARRLFATASIPWYDADVLDATLEACRRLVGRVPSQLLTFRADRDAVDLVQRWVERGRSASPVKD